MFQWLKSFMPAGLIVAGLILTAGVSPAKADLQFDVRLAGGGDSAVVEVGNVINLEVWAVITNTTGTNDGFKSAEGTLRSSTGGLLGDLSHSLVSPFLAGRAGTVQDIDGDGDLDVGVLNGVNGDNDLIWYRSEPITAGSELLVGTATFTVTDLAGGPTSIWFEVAEDIALNRNPFWTENGEELDQSTGTIIQGTMVTMIPEPGSLALLAGAGLALMLRRRRQV